MALTWKNPKNPTPPLSAARIALAQCTTGTEAATAGAADGLDLRGLAAIAVAVECVAKAQATIRPTGLLPGDTVTVNGTVFTAVGSNAQPGAAQFKCAAEYGPDRGDDWITAANLAAAINANGAVNGQLSAFVSEDEALITLTAVADGVGGNGLTLASSNAGRVVISGATFTGGVGSNNIIAGATLQASLLNPATGRWNRAPDLDLNVAAGAPDFSSPPAPVPVPMGRIQYVPNGVGSACVVTLAGFAGRQP